MDSKEKHIIEGIQSGNEEDFRKLFDMYYAKLVVFAQKYLYNLDASRDIVQEFFLYLFESRQNLSIQSSLKSYLYSSVKNRCLNQLRAEVVREKHRTEVRQETNGSDPDIDGQIDANELEAKIFEIVAELPGQCQHIFLMSRIEGKRNSEIALELKISKRTVETQISKAIKVLKNSIFPDTQGARA